MFCYIKIDQNNVCSGCPTGETFMTSSNGKNKEKCLYKHTSKTLSSSFFPKKIY